MKSANVTVGKKLVASVGALILLILFSQGAITNTIISSLLEENVAADMERYSRALAGQFDRMLQETEADLDILRAHKAFENYTTLREFGDEEGMTEQLFSLEGFLGQVAQAKNRYAKLQFAVGAQPVLQLVGAHRTEEFESYDTALATERLSADLTAEGTLVTHFVRRNEGELALLSAGGLVANDKLEGLLWLYQPVREVVEKALAEFSSMGYVATISDGNGALVAATQGSSPDLLAELSVQDVDGWFSERMPLPNLGWTVTLAIEKVDALAAVRKLTFIRASILVVSLGIAMLLLGVLVTHVITRPLRQAVGVANRIADDDLGSQIAVSSRDECGQLLRALKTMQEKLLERITKERKVAGENLRVKQALDCVSTGVMVADSAHNIVYLNDTAAAMFQGAEKDIQKDLPEFEAKRLAGFRLDHLHTDPASQRAVLDDLAERHQSDLEVGGRTFRIVANPVIDGDGDRLGTAVEWSDRTQELAVEREVDAIVNAAREGDLSQRIDLEGKAGFFQTLADGINALVDVSERILKDTVRVLGAMAKGSLTQRIDADYAGAFDQLKRDANATVAKLTEVIADIKQTAESVRTGAAEISRGNGDLSQRTEQQAANLEETASSMEQMTTTVKQNADSARQANQLALEARQRAENGGDVVSKAVGAMAEINAASSKIADIIGVIDEIAFQTNLLALNAAVEAARAGEQGRGFAVVAGEVRNLAQRSAGAAKQIKELIQDSVQRVDEGSQLVDESGATLEQIVVAVKKVSDIVAEIAAASQEQSAGIDQVNTAVMHMDDMTQQNAALVEEAAAAGENMSDQARNLTELTGFFTVHDDESKPFRKVEPANEALVAGGSHNGDPWEAF